MINLRTRPSTTPPHTAAARVTHRSPPWVFCRQVGSLSARDRNCHLIRLDVCPAVAQRLLWNVGGRVLANRPDWSVAPASQAHARTAEIMKARVNLSMVSSSRSPGTSRVFVRPVLRCAGSACLPWARRRTSGRASSGTSSLCIDPASTGALRVAAALLGQLSNQDHRGGSGPLPIVISGLMSCAVGCCRASRRQRRKPPRHQLRWVERPHLLRSMTSAYPLYDSLGTTPRTPDRPSESRCATTRFCHLYYLPFRWE